MAHSSRLPKNVKAVIGDIILTGGDIENFVNVALLSMTTATALEGLVFLKQVPLKSKVGKLQYLVEATEDIEFAEKFEPIVSSIEKFSKIRNILAHGSFSHAVLHNAPDKQDDYCFSDMFDFGVEGSLFATKVAIYNREELWSVAARGKSICDQLRELFEVRPFHELSPESVREAKPASPRSRRKDGNAKPKRSPQSPRA